MAEETAMEDVPRQTRLDDYKELLQQLAEFSQLDAIEDEIEVIKEAEVQLARYAASLNAEEHITPTPNIIYSSDNKKVYIKGNALYEVHYDGRRWYPCVVVEVMEPAEATDRLQYRVRILGYSDVEEIVFYESLRPWVSLATADYIKNGSSCHAINPDSFLYEPAVIKRLNMEGDVTVVFEGSEKESNVPLSHIITEDQKFYSQLRKVQSLTEEERAKLREERAQKKRERIEEKQLMKADLVAQDANDWQSLMSDMGFSKKRKR